MGFTVSIAIMPRQFSKQFHQTCQYVGPLEVDGFTVWFYVFVKGRRLFTV